MSGNPAQVTKVATVIIPVSDQQKMMDFYVDTLGFGVRVDIPMGDLYRWVEVAPGDQVTTIALAPPPEGQPSGGRETGISLHTNDLEGFHARLKEQGVDVDSEISRFGEPVPPMFWFRDPEGNTLLVVQ